jgi:feruloyl esterase
MIAALVVAQLTTTLMSMPCERLGSVPLERARITSASAVAAGPFAPPDADAAAAVQGQKLTPIPAHCRVTLVLEPTTDSRINVELWLPTERWNGKFLAVGNGGWAGRIQRWDDMQEALRRGYATAGTDNGHSAADGPNGMFALGHPEKIVDFAYRAIHDMTVKSKRLIGEFYSAPLDYSYFKGCSTGGRQAVMAAQRYPSDFDGIIAGALANRHIYMHTAGSARRIEVARHPERAISAEKAQLVTDALLKQCDTLGEGFVNNPRQCSFDFSSLQCAAGSKSAACLTDGELRSVEQFYGGVKNSAGQLIFSGQVVGNPLRAIGPKDIESGGVSDSISILAFQNPSYDWRTFDLDRDMPLIAAAVGYVDAVDPDLRAFKAHGGKLLLYAGWRDTGISAENTVLYYENVLAEMGKPQDDWLRLFMVPGMEHCRGGDGPNTFDTIATLERWREQDSPPAQMLGSNPESGLTRPLCPYPQYAKYNGRGARNDAQSWSCAAP